jgi:putative endopeptidase
MTMLTRRTLAASPLALVATYAVTGASAQTARGSPALGSFGIDLSARDLSVKPGDDFNRYCSGTWMRNTEIPADRTSWGAFDILRAKSETDVKALIDETVANGGPAGSNAQKIKDLYSAHLNTDEINAKGLAPAQADLAAIAALRTHQDVVALVSRPDFAGNFPIVVAISIDERDPNTYLPILTTAGLSLPDRDYYLRNDETFPQTRDQFKTHIARILTLAHESDAEAKAAAVLALETQIAQLTWPIAQRRDRTAIYNKRSRAEMVALSPTFPWEASLSALGLDDQQTFVVLELSAIGPMANLVLSTPVSTWQSYLKFQYLSNTSSVLPAAFDQETFDFFGRTLSGQPQQRERWKRSVAATNAALGDAVGQIYVQRHFSAEAKAQMIALVENMRRAYGARIDQLSWMSAEAKTAAREKLASFRVHVGYPDEWRDYSAFDVRAGDAFGNQKRSNVWQWRRQVSWLGHPANRNQWPDMTPQTVNAQNNSNWNELTFPAAILQPPFFDPNADAAVNYGAIGGVIGHEMGHGFDDQGAKSDAHGILRDWWSPTDVQHFNGLVERLAAQYDRFEPLPGIHVNGHLTSGENIGDNGGTQVAYAAYHIALGSAQAPVLEGLTGDQRFFMGWAQVWRYLIRDGALRSLVLSNEHAPPQYRVNGVVRNNAAWYAAFNVQAGDTLYLPPDQRVTIW